MMNDPHRKTVKTRKERLCDALLTAPPQTVFEVKFNKKLDQKELASLLLFKDTTTPDACASLSKMITGQERTMICTKHVNKSGDMCYKTGFLLVNEYTDEKVQFRKINLQTIQYVIIGGIKYACY